METTIKLVAGQARLGQQVAGSISIGTVAVKAARLTGLVLGALIFGLPGLVILFPGGSFPVQIITAAIYMFMTGMLVGYFSRKAWVISGFVGWGGALLAGISLIQNPVPGAMTTVLLISSLGPALLGGFLGWQIWEKYTYSKKLS